jgi:D-lactate dehydrogenase (cytochrome)
VCTDICALMCTVLLCRCPVLSCTVLCSTEEVSKIVKICHQKNIPVVPFGGGTALEGHTITTYKDSISVDFNNMRKVLEFHPDDSDIRVQAGIGYIDLNELLSPHNLWFPLDPGPGASIGGMCANRCSGSTALKYGSMRENVLNVTAVMSDGSIIKTGSRARKSSAGYDLTRLLIGSEGTLGLITEVNLKLHGVPAVSYALRVCFDDIRDAAAAARATLNSGLNIGRCEMLDDEMMKIVNKANSQLEPKWPEKYTLMYEIVGPSETSVRDQIAMVKEAARAHRGGDFLLATGKEECKNLWMIRKACIWSTISEYSDREAMITDACVPLSQLPTIMHNTRCAIDKSGLPCPIIAHAGDGNFHVVIMFRPDDPVEVRTARALAAGMAEEAIAMGGTCTGEHGIGVGKLPHLYNEMGEGSMNIMELLKLTLDPGQIMNPGKVLWMDDVYEQHKAKENITTGAGAAVPGDLRPRRSADSESSKLRSQAFHQRSDFCTHDRHVPNCLSDSGPIVPVAVPKKTKT